MTSFQPDVLGVLDILVYARPHESKTERRFIKRFISPLGVKQDQFGNRLKRIGNAPILWSCHTDTAHWTAGIQRIASDGRRVWVPKDSTGSCLGADDGAGVWLLSQMIKAGVPGLYVFHRGEERGCKGSKHIADKQPWLLRGMKAAIALDRRGTTSIITHQMGRRSASDAFAKSMEKLLGNGFKPDDTGLYTDTAQYTDIVGECSNISVGYRSEHGKQETLDLDHLRRLRDLLCRADFSKLEFKRKPGERDYKWEQWEESGWENGKWVNYRSTGTSKYGTATQGSNHRQVALTGSDYRPNVDLPPAKSTHTLERLCRDHPEIAAMMLEGVGYAADDFLAEMHSADGSAPP